MLYKISIKSVFCLLFIAISSCKGQVKNSGVSSCNLHYRNAKGDINSYYKNNDTSLLKKALKEVELSLQCPDTRPKSVELKIALFSLLKEYKNAYEYIDSLHNIDFKYPYKKMMEYDFFRGLEYESKSNLAQRDQFIERSIEEVQHYVDTQDIPNNKFDPEVYYDLFLVKSKIESIAQIDNEILALKKKYPKDSIFLDGINSSISQLVQDPAMHWHR